MALFNKGSNILVTDAGKALLHILDINGVYIKSINPNYFLQEPIAIFVRTTENDDEEIYVSDYKAKTVFLFDSNFNYIRKIGNNLYNVQYLNIESDFLYISQPDDDVVTVWNLVNDEFKVKLIEQPLHSFISENEIIIVSRADREVDFDKKRLKKLYKGNFINIINKFDLKTVHKIIFDDWFAPHTVHLTNDGNIYTLAYELDKNGYYAENRFLFIINPLNNYQLVKKIELNGIGTFSDAIFLNNKIIICAANNRDHEIQVVEFE
jgi:hypothetical protein